MKGFVLWEVSYLSLLLALREDMSLLNSAGGKLTDFDRRI